MQAKTIDAIRAVLPNSVSAQPIIDLAQTETLVDCSVETLFGYPEGVALPRYDALYSERGLHNILVGYGQAAVNAAEGYARRTRRVDVVPVTSGRGGGNN